MSRSLSTGVVESPSVTAQDADVAHLASLAPQLIARLPDTAPEANLRWLRAELGTDPRAPVSDLERLLFVVAAAVPDSDRWRDLTAWCGDPRVEERRMQWRVSARRARMRPAA